MNKVRVKKQSLLEILQANQKKHRAAFEEAIANYRKLAIELLDQSLEAARNGQKFRMHFQLIEPQDMTKEYSRAIRMLEMHVEDDIELSNQEFRNYVEDNWTWSQQWKTSNRAYISSAANMDYMEGVEDQNLSG